MDYEFGHCQKEELPQLVALANRVFRSKGEGDIGREYPILFNENNLENLLIVRSGSEIVSHIGMVIRDAVLLGAQLKVACIGGVCTAEEHRGRGLATELLRRAKEHAVSQGVSLILISGGRGLYRRAGYVQVGSFILYTIPPSENESEFEIDEFTPDDLPAILKLYEAESVRFIRPAEDWLLALQSGMLMDVPSELLVIRHHSAVVAYAGVQLPRADPKGGRTRPRVCEFAGSRRALLTCLPALPPRYDSDRIEVVALPIDVEYHILAEELCLRCESIRFTGTLGIVEPDRFLESTARIIAERSLIGFSINAVEGGVEIRMDGERAFLDSMSELTTLIFEGDDTIRTRFSPRIREALAPVFPLPLFWYGYNYA